MYTVGDSLPIDELEPAAILVTGPAMSGKYELLLKFIVEGSSYGEGELIISTNESAKGVFSDIEDRAGSVPPALRLVDCISEQQSAGDRFPSDQVEYVNSPGDLTGLGIGASEQLRRFVEEDTERVRVAFHSLSTLLMYSDIETVFRFMHVLIGRLDGIEGLGLFTIDPTTHDEGTVNTLKQIFDAAIELREGENGTEVRFVGIDETTDGWVSLE